MKRAAITRLLSLLAFLVLCVPIVLGDWTGSTDGGSGTWKDTGLSGKKTGTNSATVTVTTTTTVNATYTAVVTYKIGTVTMVGGKPQFNQIASFNRNLGVGANQEVTNDFQGLARGVEYTVKVSFVWNPGGLEADPPDRTITVAP
jgi:hypothetical protein